MAKEQTLTIARPAQEIYRFWRPLTELPRIFPHLAEVRPAGGGRSHWRAKGPADTPFEWDAEITQEVENELLEWRSLEGAQVPNRGHLRLCPAPGGQGTEVALGLDYQPPGGAVGAAFARLLRREPAQEVREGLRRLKQLLEAGEIPTVDGQSAARKT
jgi:uncharacterized membrane protein